MLKNLVKVLERFGYNYTVKPGKVNDFVYVEDVIIICCDEGYIVKYGDLYGIYPNPYTIIDCLDSVVSQTD